jgi:hypothetical protein
LHCEGGRRKRRTTPPEARLNATLAALATSPVAVAARLSTAEIASFVAAATSTPETVALATAPSTEERRAAVSCADQREKEVSE